MNIKKLGKIGSGQDGAIFGGYLFRFDAAGRGSVYLLDALSETSVPVAQFTLDKLDYIVPHSNSVVFGRDRYTENDEFPLLYSNVYNNYAKADNKKKGITCVYRLERAGSSFTTTLVQLIEVGFTEDPLWRSPHLDDVRPYGNFVVDTENALLYGFTMRDEDQTTRYFAFDLPDVRDGIWDSAAGVNRVVLKKEDVKLYFDCPYHRYIQGACFHEGILYSVEGFGADCDDTPAIRLIDVQEKKQAQVYYFPDFGLNIEPDWIDFAGGICYYSDAHGDVFQLTF